MSHECLLVVTAGGESIGKVIHYDGDETFLVEGATVFPTDFEFRDESTSRVCEDGALVYTLTEYSQEEELEPDHEAPGFGATRSIAGR